MTIDTKTSLDTAIEEALRRLLELMRSTNVKTENKIGNLNELPTMEKNDIVKAIKELSDNSLNVVNFRPEHYRLKPTGKAITHGGFYSPLYTNERVMVNPKVESANLVVRENRINEYNLLEYFTPVYDEDNGKFPDMSDISVYGSGVVAKPSVRFEYTTDDKGKPIVKPMLRVDGNIVENSTFYVNVNYRTITFNTLHDGVINIQRYLDELVVVDNTLKHPTNYCDGVVLESLRVTGYARGASRNRVYQTPYIRDHYYDFQYFSGHSDDININPFDVSYTDVTISGNMFNIFDETYNKDNYYNKEYFIVDSIEMVYEGVTYTKTFNNSGKRQTNVANMRKFVDNLTAKLYLGNHNFGVSLKLADGVDVSDFATHIVRFSGNGIADSRYASSSVGNVSSSSAMIPGDYGPYAGAISKTTKLSVDCSDSYINDVYGESDSITVEFVYLNNTYKRSIPLDKNSPSLDAIRAYILISSGREYMAWLYTTGRKIELSGNGNYAFSFSKDVIKSFTLKFEPNGFNPSQIVKKDGIVVDTDNWTITSIIVDASNTSFKTGIDLTTSDVNLKVKSMALEFNGGLKGFELPLGVEVRNLD